MRVVEARTCPSLDFFFKKSHFIRQYLKFEYIKDYVTNANFCHYSGTMHTVDSKTSLLTVLRASHTELLNL